VPLQGWLLQVMEAPTPVSALLHAGVVNLGGFVLIRFAPCWRPRRRPRLLVVAGLARLLAAFAMLTRISIKVRLAWSTVAQMGFMVLECGLGLYHMAALHLIGHSLYKAHHFLAASDVVRETREQMLGTPAPVARCSLLAGTRGGRRRGAAGAAAAGAGWPWWWTVGWPWPGHRCCGCRPPPASPPGACGGLGHRAGLGAGPDWPGSATRCRWG
jgi:NAD(P)H-quinone oxidoreductase subunit 5